MLRNAGVSCFTVHGRYFWQKGEVKKKKIKKINLKFFFYFK